jgi:MoaA/NifB/PqqE/SkfB family radical SAM enzyme
MKRTIDDFPAYIELIHDLGIKSMILRDLLIFNDDMTSEHLSQHTELAKKPIQKAFDLAKKYGIRIDDNSFPTEFFLKQDHKGTIFPKSFIREDIIRPAIPRMCCCNDPWTNLFIGTNGDVTICCERPQSFGNIYVEDFDSLWNGVLMRSFRRTINSSTPPINCRTCVKKMRSY